MNPQTTLSVKCFSTHSAPMRRSRIGSVSKNLFDTLGDCQKSSEDEQLTPVGV